MITFQQVHYEIHDEVSNNNKVHNRFIKEKTVRFKKEKRSCCTGVFATNFVFLTPKYLQFMLLTFDILNYEFC